MALIDRIEDLIKTEINTLLGKSALSVSSGSRMKTSVSRIQSLIAQLKVEESVVRRQIASYEKAINDWYEKAQFALEKGREDLAKAALREKLTCENKVQQVQQYAQQLSNSLSELENEYAVLHSHTESTQVKMNRSIREECLSARLKLKQALHSPVVRDLASHITNWENRLIKTEDNSSQGAQFEDGQTKKVKFEFNTLLRQEQVSSMLQALKDKATAAPTNKTLSN
ncbi:PspA/IM30 family protein [Pseudoalteromonas luteoviolacea]|uniref:PspA/IM30 family protein n=1 Tax=Pseudoalteromonas luteoviolacea TaxID=43657 RepID=UPI001B38F9D4|nr:PspA/IM30 family protein [Pseudoalteromonas luteoviolacea]MBQ4838145.1 PspA/IM30 family protein [Pseudoalteromonas luteoviolacea]